MAEVTRILQLRLPPQLYEAIEAETQRRKRQGQRASLTSVAVEWLEYAQKQHARPTPDVALQTHRSAR
jgi:hypothetical protein